MLVSQKWLTEYVDLPDHDELVDRLTMSGLNHEGSETVGDDRCVLRVARKKSSFPARYIDAREPQTRG